MCNIFNQLLILFGFLLFGTLAFGSKNSILTGTTQALLIFIVFYSTLGRNFDINDNFYIIATGIYFILQIVVILYIIKNNKIRAGNLTWKPILTILIFVISLVLHKILSNYGLPWFIGYILVTLSFIIGLILYRKELRFRKQPL